MVGNFLRFHLLGEGMCKETKSLAIGALSILFCMLFFGSVLSFVLYSCVQANVRANQTQCLEDLKTQNLMETHYCYNGDLKER